MVGELHYRLKVAVIRVKVSYYLECESIFKSLSKFYSLNYLLESLLHKNCFLYTFTLQRFFLILCTL